MNPNDTDSYDRTCPLCEGPKSKYAKVCERCEQERDAQKEQKREETDSV